MDDDEPEMCVRTRVGHFSLTVAQPSERYFLLVKHIGAKKKCFFILLRNVAAFQRMINGEQRGRDFLLDFDNYYLKIQECFSFPVNTEW